MEEARGRTKGRFAIAEERAVETLSPAAGWLLMKLRLLTGYPYRHADTGATVALGYREINEMIRVRWSDVPTVIAELVDGGWVSCQVGRGRAKSVFGCILQPEHDKTQPESVAGGRLVIPIRTQTPSADEVCVPHSDTTPAVVFPIQTQAEVCVPHSDTNGVCVPHSDATGTTKEDKEIKLQEGKAAEGRAAAAAPPTTGREDDRLETWIPAIKRLFVDKHHSWAIGVLKKLLEQYRDADIGAMVEELQRRKENRISFGPDLMPYVAADKEQQRTRREAGNHAQRTEPTAQPTVPRQRGDAFRRASGRSFILDDDPDLVVGGATG